MISRRGLIGGLVAFLAAAGTKISDAVGWERNLSYTLVFKKDDINPLWKRLYEARLSSPGSGDFRLGTGEMRSLAGALLKAADWTEQRRTLIVSLPNDECFVGRRGMIALSAAAPNPAIEEISVEWESLRDFCDRECDGEHPRLLGFDPETRIVRFVQRLN